MNFEEIKTENKNSIIEKLTGRKVAENAKPRVGRKKGDRQVVPTKKKTGEEDQIYTPKLTEKQRRFAELIAHGLDKESAYRAVYVSSPETKEVTIRNNSKKLVNNVEVLKEIDRLKGVIAVTQSIDEIPDEKRLELLTGTTEDEVSEVMEGEWNQKIAYSKLNELLHTCEESMTILKERPRLFGEVGQLCSEVRNAIDEDNDDYQKLIDLLDSIRDIIYKLGAFDVKEYNSTISTATSIMKMLNDITGITKNAKQIENEAFENRLLRLLSNMDIDKKKEAKAKGQDYVPLKNDMEAFAFDE